MSIKTAAFAFLFLTATLAAQVKVSAITGTVTDQQNNRIPLARVRATHSATVLQRETQTTSQGTYEIPDLPPGLYMVQFSKRDSRVLMSGAWNRFSGRPGLFGSHPVSPHASTFAGG
jgi:hypothetical protein